MSDGLLFDPFQTILFFLFYDNYLAAPYHFAGIIIGMAFGYFRFELNYWFVMLAGIFVLFSGAGFVLDWFGRKMWKEKESGGETAEESRPRRQHRIAVCVRALGVACLCAALLLYTDYFLAERYEIDVIEPLIPENDRYVLYRFLQNDSLSGINVERIKADGISFSRDPMEPYKKLADRCRGAGFPPWWIILMG